MKKKELSLLPLVPPAAAAGAILAVYYLLLRQPRWAAAWAEHVSGPYRRAVGLAAAKLPFSVMELLYALGVAALLLFLGRTVYLLARRRRRGRRLLRRGLALLLAAALLWCGYCLTWGADYMAPGFSARTGLSPRESTPEQLRALTAYFAENVSLAAEDTARDGAGHWAEDTADILARSETAYAALEAEFPALAGPYIRPKGMYFSEIMSYLGFTGIFFPFTGEPNVNTDQPGAFLPGTVAHELAHSRGVTSEAEANFLAVAACVTGPDPAYRYSGWLYGLTYLSGALYGADPAAWREIAGGLSPRVLQDLTDNSEYWARYETPVAEAAETVYDTYLRASGETLGMRSYGACVDLLAAYFGPGLPEYAQPDPAA